MSPVISFLISPSSRPLALSLDPPRPSAAYKDLRKSTCTSCLAKADLSAYWSPLLYISLSDGNFKSVPGGTKLIYYLPRSHPTDKTKVLAFPAGLEMLAGSPFRRTYNSSSLVDQAIGWNCLGATGVKETRIPELPRQNCPDGLRGVSSPLSLSFLSFSSFEEQLSRFEAESVGADPALTLAGDPLPLVLGRQEPQELDTVARRVPDRRRVWSYVLLLSRSPSSAPSRAGLTRGPCAQLARRRTPSASSRSSVRPPSLRPSCTAHSLTLEAAVEVMYDVDSMKDLWPLAKNPKSPFVLAVRRRLSPFFSPRPLESLNHVRDPAERRPYGLRLSRCVS